MALNPDRRVVYTKPLTEEQLREFDYKLVDYNLSFGEWVRIKIVEELGGEPA